MRRLLLALGFGLLAGCIVEAPADYQPPPPRGGPPAEVAPPISVRSNAVLANKLELLGVEVTPGSVAPGRSARVVMLIRVKEPLKGDYRVFVHGEDPAGRAARLLFDHVPAQGRYPTSQWKAGEVIRDEFTVSVPQDTRAKALTLWGGFWDPKTGERMPLSNPSDVQNDGKDRVLLVQIPIADD